MLAFELPGFSTVTRKRPSTGNFTANINVTMGVAALEENVTVSGDVAGGRHAVNVDLDDVRQGNPGKPAERARLLGHPLGGPRREDAAHRRRRQRRRHADHLLRLRHHGPGPADGRRHQLDRGHQRLRQLRRLRLVRRGVDRQRRIQRRESGARRVHAVHPQVRRQHYHGSFYGDKEFEDFQSYNIDAAQIAAGVTGGGGLEARDTNRLSSYSDKNADIGGFIKKDKAWWYASVRGLDSSVRYTNYPVEAHKTELRNFTAKGTYQLSQNNKLIGYYQPSSKVQPTRLDRQLLNATTAIHMATDDSFRQDYRPLLWKAEWNSIVTPSTFFEVRTGQFGYDWEDTPSGTAPSYEDLNTNIVSGRARARDYEHQAQSGPRIAELPEERLGRHAQLQVRRRMVPRDADGLHDSPAPTTTCCRSSGAACRPK